MTGGKGAVLLHSRCSINDMGFCGAAHGGWPQLCLRNHELRQWFILEQLKCTFQKHPTCYSSPTPIFFSKILFILKSERSSVCWFPS